MSQYPVASAEDLMGVVASAQALIDLLIAAKGNLKNYQDTVALYQQKVVETQDQITSIMSELSEVSDQYVTAYLGYNPKTVEQ